METFFFVSLGITFLLILMLVYHFKQRLSHIEKKGDTMFDIVNNMVKEMSVIKTMCIDNSQCQQQCSPMNSNDPFVLQHLFNQLTIPQEHLANENQEEDMSVQSISSMEDDESVSDQSDNSDYENEPESLSDRFEKVPVSDTEVDENLNMNDSVEVSDLNVETLTEPNENVVQNLPPNTEDISEISASLVYKHDTPDNTDTVSVSPSEDNHYRKMLVSELREIVHSKGIIIEGIQKLKKKELIKLLEDHSV